MCTTLQTTNFLFDYITECGKFPNGTTYGFSSTRQNHLGAGMDLVVGGSGSSQLRSDRRSPRKCPIRWLVCFRKLEHASTPTSAQISKETINLCSLFMHPLCPQPCTDQTSILHVPWTLMHLLSLRSPDRVDANACTSCDYLTPL